MEFQAYAQALRERCAQAGLAGQQPLLEELLEQAEFGYEALKEDLGRLPKTAGILEAGAGALILCGFLALQGWPVTAVEPTQAGFGGFEKLRPLVRCVLHSQQAALQQLDGYVEDSVLGARTYAYAFCINVLEHVEQPGRFVALLYGRLEPGGQLRILCPNYTIPYDGHFGLPMLFGKRFTGWLFGQKIRRMEAQRNAQGLWDSIHPITHRQLKALCRPLGLRPHFRKAGFATLLRVLLSRPQFAKRHRLIAPFVRVLVALGLPALAALLPTACTPYMDATLHKAASPAS